MCPDEWLVALGFDIYDKDARVAVEGLQWELSQTLVLRGLTVVDECGVWQRWERDLRRTWAREHGVAVELRFLDAPVEVLTARVAERNRTLPEGRAAHRPGARRLLERPDRAPRCRRARAVRSARWSAVGRAVRLSGASAAMFWFIRKKLVGSYVSFTSTSRASVAAE